MANAPTFWWREDMTPAVALLWPLSKAWSYGATRRMRRDPKFRPPVPVICVGNFVVGGAGKTPAAIALARVARGKGLQPGILASGYGGRTRAPTLVDPATHSSDDVGDEPLILAESTPTVVAADRAAGAKKLLENGANLIILDDGFQDPALAKDVTLVAIDGGGGIGNGHIIPSGPLRAPLDVQLRMADAMMVIGEGEAGEGLIRTAARAGRPVMRAELKPSTVREWRTGPVLAYAGIGRPEKFFETLRSIKVDVAQTRSFPDHHVFTEEDAGELLRAAEGDNLRLVTTEKDCVRLRHGKGALADLYQASDAFPVVLQFENPTAIGEWIDEAIRRAATAGA